MHFWHHHRPTSQIPRLQDLLHVKFEKQHQTWATSVEFEQDHIGIGLVISSEYSKNLAPVVKYVKECDGSVFVFANSKALTYKLLASLESKSCWCGIYLESDATRKYKLSEIKK